MSRLPLGRELPTATAASGDFVPGFDTSDSGKSKKFPVSDFALATRSEQIIVPICGNAKVGATAGWVVTGGTDICHATLPASQTSSTLVVPVTGLHIGDTLTAVSVTGQVESAGNNVTLVMSLRKLTTAAGANTDAELGTDNVGTLTADTLISSANLEVGSQTEVLAEGETVYALLTGTTAASTDIDLTGLVVTVTRA